MTGIQIIKIHLRGHLDGGALLQSHRARALTELIGICSTAGGSSPELQPAFSLEITTAITFLRLRESFIEPKIPGRSSGQDGEEGYLETLPKRSFVPGNSVPTHDIITMKITHLSLLFLSALCNALENVGDKPEPVEAVVPSLNTSDSTFTSDSSSSFEIAEIGAIPLSDSTPSFSPNIPVPLRQFIMKMASSPGSSQYPDEISPRQQGGVGGGAAAPAPTPTQLSPVTVYFDFVKSVQVTYTQTFAPTPDPWAAPKAGSIGLGTLTGQVGAVKTAQADAGALKARGGVAIAGAGLGGYLLL